MRHALTILGLLLAAPPVRGEATVPAARAEPTGPLTLEAAIELALGRSPELEAYAHAIDAAGGRRTDAGAIPNPELDVRIGRDDGQDDERLRVVLRQDLELGGKRARRLDVASEELAIATAEREIVRAEVAAATAARFAEVLGAQRRVESWSAASSYFEEMHGRIGRMIEKGALRSLEGTRSTQRLGAVRIELHEARSDLAAARHALSATWRGGAPRFAEAVGTLEAAPSLPPIEAVLAHARDGQVAVLWDAIVRREEAALRLARSGRVPDLTYGAGVRWEDDTGERDYLVDLEIGLPIFDRRRGAIASATHELGRAEAARVADEATREAEVARLYYEVQAAEAARAILAGDVLPAARSAFDAHRVGFEAGADNLEDLLDAREDLAEAEDRLTHALVERRAAWLALEALLGRPLRTGE